MAAPAIDDKVFALPVRWNGWVYSDPARTPVQPDLPVAPAITGPVRVNSTTLRVTITAPGAGADTWTLQRSAAGFNSWSNIGTVAVGASTADFSVTTGVEFDLRIAAANENGVSYSNLVTGTASETPEGALYTETWESATVGAGVDGRTWGVGDARWGRGTGSANATVQNAYAASGSKSARIRFTTAAGQLAFDLGAHYREVTITFKWRVPENWKHRTTGSPTNNKMFRIWGDDGGAQNGYDNTEKVGSSMWRENDFRSRISADYNNGGGMGELPGTNYSGFLTSADAGLWHDIEIYVKACSASGAADGVIRLKKNGVTIYNATNVNNWFSGKPHAYRHGYLMGWANTGYDEATDYYLDDISFTVVP